MEKLVKNVSHGIGDVLVVIPPGRNYTRLSRGGFSEDLQRLVADHKIIKSELSCSIRKAYTKNDKK